MRTKNRLETVDATMSHKQKVLSAINKAVR